MIENRHIASLFNELANLMEYSGESPFRIRSYEQAYQLFRKLEEPLGHLERDQIKLLPGIGDAISDKVIEIVFTGTFQTLEQYRANVPEGIRELLKIRGLGPKKVKSLVDGLAISNPGELLYACEENRLAALKGFGQKSQEAIAEKIQFAMEQSGKLLLPQILTKAHELLELLVLHFPTAQISLTGALRRMEYTQSSIELLSTIVPDESIGDLHFQPTNATWTFQEVQVHFHKTTRESWGTDLVKTSGGLPDSIISTIRNNVETEEEVFKALNIAYIIPIRRNEIWYADLEKAATIPMVKEADIKGILHAHSTWSDGASSLGAMAEYCKSAGFNYLGITDHSVSAYYANGLNEKRLIEQWKEIDAINKTEKDFKILKGIESDILNDGSLDYSDDIIAKFDFVIASVHNVLNMDTDRATKRLIKAIEHPYTHILGHPTGRLLLSRAGYMPDMKKIIDAAATNQVAIEINANPQRLDLDYTWIPYAMDKGVWLSINPDAHQKKGIHDIKWGLISANKGGLYPELCLNLKTYDELIVHFRNKLS